MGMLLRVEIERVGQRIDGRIRRADHATLLQPNVPVRRDAGALGDFFASKSRRTAALVGSERDRGRP